MTTKLRLVDNFGRRFPYLRLSITDVCNFSCSYCLPNGYQKSGCENFLSISEISRIAKAFSALGVWKIRLTGGEPTVRKDFIPIVETLSAIPGIKHLAFTTNGYQLSKNAKKYFDAGLRAINISIDSLNAIKFKTITGHDRLNEILDGIEACYSAGFKTVKINTVLLKDLNDAELDNFIAFIKDKPLTLRFIELMQTNDNTVYFDTRHLSGTLIAKRLLTQGWQIKPRVDGAGPAQEFEHPHSKGIIGLITPYAKDFCQSCNRIRTSSKGQLHLCLFGERGYPLRHLLQSDDQQEVLQQQILMLLQHKKSAHLLHDNNSGVRDHLASIGG